MTFLYPLLHFLCYTDRNLVNNPLLCDCELRWIPQFLSDTPPLFFTAGMCNAPALVSGMAVNSLLEDQFICGMFSSLPILFTTWVVWVVYLLVYYAMAVKSPFIRLCS